MQEKYSYTLKKIKQEKMHTSQDIIAQRRELFNCLPKEQKLELLGFSNIKIEIAFASFLLISKFDFLLRFTMFSEITMTGGCEHLR